MTTTPKTVYEAAISYRTPAGHKVRYHQTAIAATCLEELEEEMRRRLTNEDLYGRRKVASVVGEFSCSIIGRQVATS